MKARLLATSLSLTLILSVGVSSAALPQAAADTVPQVSPIAAERAPTRGPSFTAEQRGVARLVNDTRSARGKARLTLNPTLTRKAQQWAEYLARANRLAHSDLTAGVPSNWRALGENVGYAPTIDRVHQAFMDSSGHRDNILGRWSQLGTGYATRGNLVFVVHVFMRT